MTVYTAKHNRAIMRGGPAFPVSHLPVMYFPVPHVQRHRREIDTNCCRHCSLAVTTTDHPRWETANRPGADHLEWAAADRTPQATADGHKEIPVHLEEDYQLRANLQLGLLQLLVTLGSNNLINPSILGMTRTLKPGIADPAICSYDVVALTCLTHCVKRLLRWNYLNVFIVCVVHWLL